jgi:hypothetical protein
MRWCPRNLWPLQSIESRLLLAESSGSRFWNSSIATADVSATCHFNDSYGAGACELSPKRF